MRPLHKKGDTVYFLVPDGYDKAVRINPPECYKVLSGEITEIIYNVSLDEWIYAIDVDGVRFACRESEVHDDTEGVKQCIDMGIERLAKTRSGVEVSSCKT